MLRVIIWTAYAALTATLIGVCFALGLLGSSGLDLLRATLTLAPDGLDLLSLGLVGLLGASWLIASGALLWRRVGSITKQRIQAEEAQDDGMFDRVEPSLFMNTVFVTDTVLKNERRGVQTRAEPTTADRRVVDRRLDDRRVMDRIHQSQPRREAPRLEPAANATEAAFKGLELPIELVARTAAHRETADSARRRRSGAEMADING